jgi:predicted amino acid-binding ACT domain protein
MLTFKQPIRDANFPTPPQPVVNQGVNLLGELQELIPDANEGDTQELADGSLAIYQGGEWSIAASCIGGAIEPGSIVAISSEGIGEPVTLSTVQDVVQANVFDEILPAPVIYENTINDEFQFSIRVVNERDICKTLDNMNILTITFIGLDDRYHEDTDTSNITLDKEATPESIDFINNLLYRVQTGDMQKGIIDAMRARLADHGFSYITSINQAVADNCIPMFWAVTLDSEIVYTRENSRDAIKYFRQKYNISKKQWKELVNLDKYDLHLPYMANNKFFLDIKYPRKWIRGDENNFNRFNQDCWKGAMLYNFTKNLITPDIELDLNDYQTICRDFMDLCGTIERDDFVSRIPQVMTELSRKKNFDTFTEQIHEFEREFGEIIAELEELKAEQADKEFAKRFEWIDKLGLPAEFKGTKTSGRIINTPAKLRAEGKTMKHCVNSYYKDKVANQTYLVYHITDKNVAHYEGGETTLGLVWSNGQFKYDQMRGICNTGYSNGDEKNAAATKMQERIIKELNQRIADIKALADSTDQDTNSIAGLLQILEKAESEKETLIENADQPENAAKLGIFQRVFGNIIPEPKEITLEIDRKEAIG